MGCGLCKPDPDSGLIQLSPSLMNELQQWHLLVADTCIFSRLTVAFAWDLKKQSLRRRFTYGVYPQDLLEVSDGAHRAVTQHFINLFRDGVSLPIDNKEKG